MDIMFEKISEAISHYENLGSNIRLWKSQRPQIKIELKYKKFLLTLTPSCEQISQRKRKEKDWKYVANSNYSELIAYGLIFPSWYSTILLLVCQRSIFGAIGELEKLR